MERILNNKININEYDAVLAYNISNFIKNELIHNSNFDSICVCKKCGLLFKQTCQKNNYCSDCQIIQ
jgi:protein-arginine kinase activator protein McsA